MAFWNLETAALADFRPGIRSKAEIGDDLTMVCMEVAADQADAGHSHPFDQCGLVLSGEIEMFVGDERQVLGPQTSYFIPAGVRHGWRVIKGPVRLFDISSKPPAA